jgi:hypothetical protein
MASPLPLLLIGCSLSLLLLPNTVEQDRSAALTSMDHIAERYVKLALALGEHDSNYVDAYYGPPVWRDEVRASTPSLGDVDRVAAALLGELERTQPAAGDEMHALRHAYLTRQLESMRVRIAMLRGRTFTFDDESRGLYDAEAPHLDEKHFATLRQAIDEHIPGEGPLVERYERWRKQFVIPPDRLDAVFTAAIRECRARTLEHIELPAEESFTVEYVKDKPWSAYNWYKGEFRSVIQVNTDLPIYIDRAVDLACHEGYPGHHVYNALLEKHLLRDRRWVEFSVYALFSPQSLIAEGTANYGIDVAFPGRDRAAFEREVLFPLAGLDAAKVADYYQVYDRVEQLAYADNEAARRYLDGTLTREQAIAWLVEHAIVPRQRAEQRLRFIDQYRSYVINYNLGEDLVREFIERRAGKDGPPERRWEQFENLLSSPRLPSGLK